TAFCSYGGQALDKKTPLLRSMQALSKQALRILRLFGNTEAVRVYPTVGPEQEYFLMDKEVYRKRPDLMVAGRTLFGAKPPKGQELEDHYFGVIKPRVKAFMKELDAELWKLGILAKTEHNEVAPAQHEMAPIYTTVNIAADHNQLTMDIMKKVADRHGMVCLLHEKPFEGVNGSGKHNNYALSTDTGVNLLDPGDTPSENAQFLVFLSAVIAAVDDYQDLMRVAVASAGNDHRLGANEAPPAIISIFLGDELNEIIESIVNASKYEAHERDQMKLGVHILPRFPKDSTDRNRTSPFAFTGNKFEFRSLGSAQSISGPNVILNTAIADTLMKMADELEGAEDMTAAVDALIRKTLSAHMRIIFNGNGYDQAWVEEAKRRGLLNLPTTVDALPYYVDPKNIALFERQKVFTRQEVESRYEIKMETYIKVIDIEAMSMIDISRHLILPAAIAYAKDVASTINVKKSVAPELEAEAEKALLSSLTVQTNALYKATDRLEAVLRDCDTGADMLERARYTRDQVITAMNDVRAAGDALEGIVGKNYWPMPTYQDLLMSV
ncbi:MAG: glutamine synthetase type III, partial [Clostridiales bacterium]|nr:glutamine synthetase type III [Clostridiales bacterium]